MYTKRVQIVNYGPIDHLDILFPFEGETPKPVVLVGENGSGKSILLSHVVNGLVAAKDLVYSETPEVEMNKVYKIRSGAYIKSGREFYFARIDFENGMFTEEMRSKLIKKEYSSPPDGLSESDIKNAWAKIDPKAHDHFETNFVHKKDQAKDLFFKNCVLHFPPNRFDEPAWLNETNLKAQAEHMDLKHLVRHTSRKLINYSPLHDNQNWLFDVVYDRAVFEARIANFPIKGSPVSLPIQAGYFGNATSLYEIALNIVQSVMKEKRGTRFGIGKRLHRVVSIVGKSGQIVPNIFQLSSGEVSLLNLFLSILRDFDLSGSTFDKAEDIRGIAVVDEIDLHLHAIHQYTILPDLIRMFPKVQFIVTTHSPLFVLGMKNSFGEDGVALYRLPQGQQISPEEL